MFKNNFFKALITLFTFIALTTLLFSVVMFYFLNKPYSENILAQYMLIGLIVGMYPMFLSYSKFKFAKTIFYSGYIVSYILFLYLIYSNQNSDSNFVIALITWLTIIVGSIVIGLLFEFTKAIYEKVKDVDNI